MGKEAAAASMCVPSFRRVGGVDGVGGRTTIADPTRLWSVLSGNVTLGPMAQRCRGVGISRMSMILCEDSRKRGAGSGGDRGSARSEQGGGAGERCVSDVCCLLKKSTQLRPKKQKTLWNKIRLKKKGSYPGTERCCNPDNSCDSCDIYTPHT